MRGNQVSQPGVTYMVMHQGVKKGVSHRQRLKPMGDSLPHMAPPKAPQSDPEPLLKSSVPPRPAQPDTRTDGPKAHPPVAVTIATRSVPEPLPKNSVPPRPAQPDTRTVAMGESHLPHHSSTLAATSSPVVDSNNPTPLAQGVKVDMDPLSKPGLDPDGGFPVSTQTIPGLVICDPQETTNLPPAALGAKVELETLNNLGPDTEGISASVLAGPFLNTDGTTNRGTSLDSDFGTALASDSIE